MDNNWISVDDRIPDSDQDVLCWTSFNVCIIGSYDGEWNGDLRGEYVGEEFVTHWQPLPSPPNTTIK